MMNLRSRILLIVAAALCSLVYVLPIWSVQLFAPQYNDGLGMYIMVDDVVGHQKHDLQNINILNHYVGMRPIHRDDFPEFEYMPWLFGLLIALAVLAAVTGKKWVLIVWLTYFLLLGIVGLADFYYWGYQYGHDLDPTAPIKVPGQGYQPPLIGTKQLLNITAHSWPASGSYALLVAKVLGLYVLYDMYKKRK